LIQPKTVIGRNYKTASSKVAFEVKTLRKLYLKCNQLEKGGQWKSKFSHSSNGKQESLSTDIFTAIKFVMNVILSICYKYHNNGT